MKSQYRCSLINLDECANGANSNDDDLDAILGELSVLESQFENELAGVEKRLGQISNNNNNNNNNVDDDEDDDKCSTLKRSTANSAKDEEDTNSSSSGMQSGNNTPPASNPQPQQNGASAATSNNPTRTANGQRTESPDNDSAFCDNLSVLSSCSAASSACSKNVNEHKNANNIASSSSGVSSNITSPTVRQQQQQQQQQLQARQVDRAEDEEARIKAEKIKLAIEKIKEASIKKLFIKVFTADGSAKSLLIDEKMTVSHVTRILAEKNHVKLDPKWTLVELVPELYMERVYEDQENLVENCLMWKVDSKNTLWFIERPEKFDLFIRPELYLLGSSSSQKGDLMEEHSRQELLEEFFSSSGVGAPEVEGFIWLKAENKKSWKKFYFVLRASGLYYAPKGKKTSKDLICLSTFDVNQVYYGSGWKKKYKSPTDYCFAIKHPQIQAKTPKYIRYLCVDSERELHQWVTGIRIAKNGKQLFDNYRSIEEEITHADIDILTSKRFSVNSSNTLQIPTNQMSAGVVNPAQQSPSSAAVAGVNGGGTASPARTPNSENKSLDSALSSGIISDAASQSNSSQFSSASSSSEYPHQRLHNGGSESSSSQNNTPVNTIERVQQNGFQRNNSRSSKSSSIENAFESDFPAGGTIKKRPAVNPRLPLTNTTWGLVSRDSEDDEDDSSGGGSSISDGGPNVRVGGGGTLLRSAMARHSLRKQQQQQIQQQHNVQQVMAQVHVDPMSAEFEADLPPPPRDESLDRMALSTTSIDDELPPPPPPELIPQSNLANKPPMPPPLSAKPVASPLPPSLKRNLNNSHQQCSPKHGPIQRRISFDDNVQMIGDSPPSHKMAPSAGIRRQPMPTPNRLYEGNATASDAAPPKAFLQDLQRVMNKKWQVAEKCRQEDGSTPHQVLGFRDVDLAHLVGEPQNYSRDNTVGAWVLHSQMTRNRSPSPPPPPPPMAPQVPRHAGEPLYAVSRKHHPASGQSAAPPVILREPTNGTC